MFIEGSERPVGTLRADICVVGGGATGVTLARELAGSATHVVVLEGGGSTPGTDDRPTYAMVPGTPSRLGNEAKPQYLGGNTNHWFGNCRPLDRADFEGMHVSPRSGWPIDREALVPYYERAQDRAGLGGFHWYDADACRPLLEHGPVDVDGSVLQTRIVQTCPVLSFADLHREALAAAENVHVLLETRAVRLEADAAGGRVVAIEAVGTDGRRARIEADTVVLASGGVENTRLLLCSNDVATAGLGNDHDLVGRCFMEHWYFDFDLGDWAPESDLHLYELGPERIDGYQALQVAGDARVWAQLVLSEALMRDQNVPGLSIWFAPTSLLRLRPSVTALRRLAGPLRHRVRPEQPMTDLWQVLRDPVAVARFFRWKLAGKTMPPTLAGPDAYGLRVQLEQTPDPENRIRLSGSVDRDGFPEAELTLQMDEAQRQAHTRSFEAAADTLGLDGAQLASELGRRLTAGQFGFFYHHMGSTRMSHDPTDGVVDRNCRVHGISNLYVTGASVFPTGGTAAPTLTAVALAVRLADHLLGRNGVATD